MKPEKVVHVLAVLVAGFAVSKVLDLVWQQIFGRKPPQDDDEGVHVRELMLFAAVSGALSALARVVVARASRRLVAGLERDAA